MKGATRRMRIERRFHDDVRMQIGNGRIGAAAGGARAATPVVELRAEKGRGENNRAGRELLGIFE